jgi:hypothetical protein
LIKTRYPYGFEGLSFIEERSDTPGYFSMITILGRQRNRKMPLFYYCVGIVLFILFASNIRSKLMVRQPLLPLLPPMPHPYFKHLPNFHFYCI